MSIKFIKENEQLLMIYSPDFNGENIRLQIDKGEPFSIKNGCFRLNKIIEVLQSENADYLDPEYIFVVGKLDGDYYLLDREVFGTDNDFYFEKSYKFEKSTFIAYRNISVLRKIDDLLKTTVYIGGTHREGWLPLSDFKELIRTFPNSTELDRYAHTRIAGILRNHFNGLGNIQADYENYINKKSEGINSNLYEDLSPLQLETFRTVLKKIKEMLSNSESYSETNWQEIICDVVRLLYPKYILAIREVEIGNDGRHKKRPDFILIDSNGFVDVLEIKKPNNQRVITSTEYRNNYIADRDLEGAIVQIEKYMFTMNRYGKKLEEELQRLLADELVSGVKIKVSNSQGMLLMGRSNDLNENQNHDFEIIKRQYKNIVDFMTYDDLVKRLENIVSSIEKVNS